MWTWHTRMWIAHGALRQQTSIGIGWYIVMILVILVLAAALNLAERKDW